MIKTIIKFIITFTLSYQVYAKEIIIADFSNNKINIDVGFNGTKLLFFGVIDGEGDVVVSVTGPRKTIKVRRKEKKMGFWINTDSKVFYDVPSYYYVAATKKLNNLDADNIFIINQIGIKNLRFEGGEEKTKAERESWKDGIIESMVKLERYFPEQGKVHLSNNKLFKTELNFSSEIIDGEYLVDTLLLNNGNVTAARRSFVLVSKSGFGEKIFKTASERGLTYGILAVLSALFFGFIIHETIRRFNA